MQAQLQMREAQTGVRTSFYVRPDGCLWQLVKLHRCGLGEQAFDACFAAFYSRAACWAVCAMRAQRSAFCDSHMVRPNSR